MGFEDVKADGLSVDNLQKETERYNDIYFGKSSLCDLFGTTKPIKGQLEKYNEAKMEFLKQEFNEVQKYFSSLERWEIREENNIYTMRATSDIYIKYKYDNECYIEFKNHDIRKKYAIDIESDFKENPYYALDTNSKGWGDKKYAPRGGEFIQPDRIKKNLDEIKAVIAHNDSLNGEYNFKIMVDKDGYNYDRYEADIKWIEYNSIMDIIREISEEYY